MKNKISIVFLALCIIFTFSACGKNVPSTATVKEEANIQIVDDMNNTISMDKPAKRIISLYSAHTENLFALELSDEIVGVGKSDAYPYEVTKKNVFDYKSDPEKVIAEDPDLVLIRPFINKSKPEFVEALKNAGINVVSLYPDSFEKFPEYIMKLGILTGKEDMAKNKLDKFNEDIEELRKVTENMNPKTKVFFESTETNYRTITPNSMAAHAIEYAGGENVASDAVAMRKGTTIASYGIERILEKAEDIEVYISQRGAMNSGGNLHSISIRPGFDAIKALQDERVYTINEKLVSSPTFRFVKGVKELSRMFYPEIIDNLDEFNKDERLNKREFAKMAVMAKHRPIFSPTSKYYRKEHRGHTYGTFEDIDFTDVDFDYIETAVLAGYVDYEDTLFNPNKEITREELAKSIYVMYELKNKDLISINIRDIEECDNKNIAEIVVKNNILSLEDGSFNPKRVVTKKEALEAINKAKEISMD
ncbi:ABC transporter substrate-binding protein [Anaeromicrobium sediminis]|uniref:Fe/B12 periplasmic-binding domain-containing protein n=1 Tax=Anaeromicrobium sediminis TaxID=1478221 RepID=A0A267MEF0_9FIRM|nr:ABC transporter substrate-binding protein [Anaeromicrobium sediminis]PAB57951.1 hypothetical protein CCE28_17470 [Anaeromicrobium sediminis]